MKKKYNDFGTFKKMRENYLSYFKKFDLKEREVNNYFDKYKFKLGFLLRFAMKTKEMALNIKTFDCKELDNVVYSQFDLIPGEEYLMDFTYMVKPKPEYNAPFIHGDILMPTTGVKGCYHMDFYTFNPDEFDWSKFFGKDMKKIEKALEIVEKYQKTDDRGKLTKHLVPFKSKYRIELKEPQKATEEERENYFKASYECFDLYLGAYCSAMSRQKANKSKDVINVNVNGIKEFVSLLNEKDIAMKLGRMLFPTKADYEKYFFEVFWHTEVPEKK